ncbi:MAG: AAA family ATPase [Myxococcales bacterium]
MRFRRLSLDAYGPFTGTALDLSRASGNGLHLIYGPNEAGKSSALRAIRSLLFGISDKTLDAHLHAGPSLRLSALIERDGAELAFARRKKRKDSLVGPDDQPLDEARLARFLNGLDAASFDRLFGLDAERLKLGGEEMLAGQGDVGEALFDAGASGRSVHRVKLALVEEAEALFKDRAQKPELNRLLAVYAEQKRRAKDSQHSPEKYEEQQQRVREKRREAEGRRAELSRLRAQKEHAGKLRSVLSSVVERDHKLALLAALGEVPSLRRGIAEERERLSAQLLEAERDVARLSQKVAEEQGKLGRLPAPSRLLGMAEDAVQTVGRLIGAAQSSLEDLPKRQGAARKMSEAIAARLPRVGLGADIETVLARSLPVAEQARVAALGREFQGLALKLESAERELPDARAKVEALMNGLSQLEAARQIGRDALLPAEVLERFEGELSQAEEQVDALRQRLNEGEREKAALVHQLELLRGREGVPNAAALAEARTQRDLRLREAQELAADPKRKALELCLPLAALAQASAYADSLGDRLRSEAQRVADVEALEQQLAKHERDRQQLRRERDSAEEALNAVALRWEGVARGLGSAQLLPREAARLLQQEREAWREIARQEQELSRARAALGAAEARATEAGRALGVWREEWQTAVEPLGLPANARPEQALALLGALSELSSQRELLADMERRVVGIQRDIAHFTSKVHELTDAFAPELSALAPPEAATRLLELHRRASEHARERAAVEAELERARRELAEAEARRSEHQQALSALCREAGASDASALFELEQKVLRARELTQELEQLSGRLAEVCEGEDVDALVEEARQSDKGAVAAQLAELDDLIALREDETREAEREVTQLELGLRTYEGRDGADAAQELSATVARLAELSSTWARRRLAAAVLERVVDQYREKHQGPVLSRASELFRRLTLGRFSRLQVGLEETRLECVEAIDGKGLELEQLSTGTRMQLFLALKLASLEQYLKTAPPLPLVLDDVLVEWDDDRLPVALGVLAEFSERVQILLFTHHGRDLAKAEALNDSRICTHQLVPRGAQAATAAEARPGLPGAT